MSSPNCYVPMSRLAHQSISGASAVTNRDDSPTGTIHNHFPTPVPLRRSDCKLHDYGWGPEHVSCTCQPTGAPQHASGVPLTTQIGTPARAGHPRDTV